ncbi:Cullin-associated NEDD8-dissociated protein 1 [Cichlidogyrus casuarinus]|uniref:Cullin-associated NEDD8-dissociated protein 1 n=1 Tax=Cichlidogyrus casuarinus TaxID=1844966 RepID=A0ABD2PZA4_9PLAT
MEAEDVKTCLEVVKTRLCNESTSLTAIKAIQILASSPDSELSNGYCCTFLPPVLEQVSQLLLKNQRNLRLASLHCLHTSWSCKASLLLSTTGDCQNALQTCISNILHELPQLINDSELLTAQLSIQLAVILFKLADPKHPQLTEKLEHLLSSDAMLGALETLSLSPLLQGSAQQHTVHQLMFEVASLCLVDPF